MLRSGPLAKMASFLVSGAPRTMSRAAKRRRLLFHRLPSHALEHQTRVVPQLGGSFQRSISSAISVLLLLLIKAQGTEWPPAASVLTPTPVHEIPEGACSRKVDAQGFFSFRGREYRLGVGMAGHRVVIAQAELGMRLSFQGFDLPYLHEL